MEQKEEADRAEAEKTQRAAIERYRQKMEEYSIWQALPWPVQMLSAEPEYPGYPALAFGSYSYPFLPRSVYMWAGICQVDRAMALKKEAADMIDSARTEPKEFHFTEQQFTRMREWETGQVVKLVKEKISSPILII
jgi:hypothetical protein